ncbi:MAG: hypothetical protein GX592_04840 [Clostridiales bacterium]|nr:hypothetical protein [Clostridiales bacterium]
MSVSIEAYLLTNFVMNLLAIAAIARSLGRVKWARVLLAAALGAVYAVLAQLPRLRFLGSFALLPLFSAVLSAIALPADSLRSVATGALSLLAGAVFLGGVQLSAMRLFSGSPTLVFLLGALVGTGALVAVSSVRRKRIVTWEVQVFLSVNGGEARFKALIDTGNRLKEPLSGLPVLIVERAVLADVLPGNYDQCSANGAAPPGFRQVGYGALGGSGRLNCFQPELSLVDYGNGFLKSPDLWVAVYPGKMPGGVRALAPPIVGAAEPSSTRGRQKLSI